MAARRLASAAWIAALPPRSPLSSGLMTIGAATVSTAAVRRRITFPRIGQVI
jgi:hypothetical protein